MGTQIRNQPHPRKTNAVARANATDLYQTVLEHELFFGLTKRNPDKARRVAREMRWSGDRQLETMAHSLEEHLPSKD